MVRAGRVVAVREPHPPRRLPRRRGVLSMDRSDVVARDRARDRQRVPRGRTGRAHEAGDPFDRRVPSVRGRGMVVLHRFRRLRRRARVDGVRARLAPSGGRHARSGGAGGPSRDPSARCGDPVPAGRRAEPRRHLHGVPPSGRWTVHVHQPPALRAPRLRAGGPTRRSRLVVGTRPSRGQGRGAAGQPDLVLARHGLRSDLPDTEGGRLMGVGAGQGPAGSGRGRARSCTGRASSSA